MINDFFSLLYEKLFYSQGFSNDMYESGAYVTIGLIMVCSSIVLEVIYYYLLSSYASFYKRIFWLVWLLFIAIVNFSVAFHYSTVAIENAGVEYPFSDHVGFSLINSLWAGIFSFVFSILLKTKSIKGSRTPF